MTIKVADKTMTEAAQIFRCARSTVYKMLDRGDPMLVAWIAEREARIEAEQALKRVTWEMQMRGLK